jgi:hypothetical protein
MAGIRTDAADPLGDLLGVEGVPAFEDVLEPSKHFTGCFRIHDRFVLDIGFDTQVTFQTCHGTELNFH